MNPRSTKFQTSMIAVGAAFGVALAVGAASTAGAQSGAERQSFEPYTPAPNATDLKSTLFNWMWHMGMLKGHDERDVVATLEYQGAGTIDVDGAPCELSRYRVSTHYQSLVQRTDFACTLPDGQEHANIEVVSGLYAWDEDVRGAEIGRTGGTATPRPETVEERLIRFWASPQGAPKAAVAASVETFWLGANPGTLFDDGVMESGETTLSWESGKAVLTFPLMGVPGAMATATLDERYMTESVVVTHGDDTTEFTYGDYEDWNNLLHLIEVFYAGRMVERLNGEVVRELDTVETETGNVYVVAPVPASVREAIGETEALPRPVMAKVEPPVDMTVPTPRLAGKPDMTGVWAHSDRVGNYQTGGGRRCGPTQNDECSRRINQTEDYALYAPSRFGGTGYPLYEPEYWDEIQQLDMWTNIEDPVMTCQPLGIPRHGVPRRIYQTENDITFIYGQFADAGGGTGEYRIIPTDGRDHTPNAEYSYTYMGSTVGHWEGDTLVLDSIGFTDRTWIGRGGFFHTDRMRVIERLTRRGNALLFDVTVQDPDVLVEPYVIPTRTLRLNENPDAGLLPERGNCETYEDDAIATQIRH